MRSKRRRLEDNFFRTIQRDREVGNKHKRDSSLHLSAALVRRLSKIDVFEGHTGCVNKLCWNDSGTMLASCSDDKNIILWDYPRMGRSTAKKIVRTRHQLNIFGIKFLPCTGDRKIVTGAMDCLVQLHDVERVSDISYKAKTEEVHAIHTDRVKGVEVEPLNPHMYWSASEDGTVLQFDRRIRTGPNILITCTKLEGRRRSFSNSVVQVKNLCINKSCPHEIALACGDPYVRVYDRRMLSLNSITRFTDSLMEFCPPHLAIHGYIANNSIADSVYTTCVSFGNTGRNVVASWHNDHAYSFSLHEQKENEASVSYRDQSHVSVPEIENTSECIEEINKGLIQYPNCVKLLLARAKNYLVRKWKGDCSFALLDSERALKLDPFEPLAYIYQMRSMINLQQLDTVHYLHQKFSSKFPKLLCNEVARDVHIELSLLQNEIRMLDAPGQYKEDKEIMKHIMEKGPIYQRYIGHCNYQTDTKEVNFLGLDDSIVASGSDDGFVMLYDAHTGCLLKRLNADDDIANCVQCHPLQPVLATSGLCNYIRLWSPRNYFHVDECDSDRKGLLRAMELNQEVMEENDRATLSFESYRSHIETMHNLSRRLGLDLDQTSSERSSEDDSLEVNTRISNQRHIPECRVT